MGAEPETLLRVLISSSWVPWHGSEWHTWSEPCTLQAGWANYLSSIKVICETTFLNFCHEVRINSNLQKVQSGNLFHNFLKGVFVCSCWPGWCPDWKFLLGALLPRAWHCSWWQDAQWQSSWRWLLLHFLPRDRSGKTCPKGHLCGPRAQCSWWN